jgi:hypothetical protein
MKIKYDVEKKKIKLRIFGEAENRKNGNGGRKVEKSK